jgi:hypothetical protein
VAGRERTVVRRRDERPRLRVPDVWTLDVEEILQPSRAKVCDGDCQDGQNEDAGAAPHKGKHKRDRDPDEP